MAYATDTSVSVEKSRAELETILRKYGASAFGYMTSDQQAMIQFRAQERTIRFILPLPNPADREFTTHSRGLRTREAAAAMWEQACRSAWRALLLVIKAELEAVERGIRKFEDAFMSNIVLPNGRTVSEELMPQITDACLSGKMPIFALQLTER